MAQPPPDDQFRQLLAALLAAYFTAEQQLLGGVAGILRFTSPDYLSQLAALSKMRRLAGQVRANLGAADQAYAGPLVQKAIEAGHVSGSKELARVSKDLVRVPPPFDFSVPHGERSVQAIRDDLVSPLEDVKRRITRLPDDVYKLISPAAAAGQALGHGYTPAQAQAYAWREYVRQGVRGFTDRSGRDWSLSAYVEMSVRTATMRAFNDSHRQVMTAAGITLFTVSDDGHPCPLCVVSGTLVSGPAPVGAVRTEYSGNLITIRTALGNELTATPDHTVLTPNGWRRMKDLAPGDKVIHDGGQELLSRLTMPDHVQVPTRIEDVVQPGLPLLLARPAGGEFDVDIAYREVEVVDPHRVLLSEGEATFAEPFGDLLLVPRVGECLSCLRERDASLRLERPRYPARRLVGGGDDGGALGLAESVPPALVPSGPTSEQLLGGQGVDSALQPVVPRTHGDSGAPQLRSDVLMADTEGGAELARAFASEVAADEIVEWNVSDFSGHVWDIQTDQHWYSSNGIISHNCFPWQNRVITDTPDGVHPTIADATAAGLWHPNCKHVLTAVVEGFTKLPARREWTAEDQRLYNLTQKQRRLELEIRKAKRSLEYATDPTSHAAARADVRREQARMRQFIEQTGFLRYSRREQVDLANDHLKLPT